MRASERRLAPGVKQYKAVVIGGSAGGAEAIQGILLALPKNFALPILAVQHLHPSDDGSFALHMASLTQIPVVEPCDKARIEPGCVYTAPANYHMLVERDGTISLSVEERVNWSRPSIDVLFESAAFAWGESVIAVILSGANTDGVQGMIAVKEAGGLTIAQDPAEARNPVMPQAAIGAGAVASVLRADEIGRLLAMLGGQETLSSSGNGQSMRKNHDGE